MLAEGRKGFGSWSDETAVTRHLHDRQLWDWHRRGCHGPVTVWEVHTHTHTYAQLQEYWHIHSCTLHTDAQAHVHPHTLYYTHILTHTWECQVAWMRLTATRATGSHSHTPVVDSHYKPLCMCVCVCARARVVCITGKFFRDTLHYLSICIIFVM